MSAKHSVIAISGPTGSGKTCVAVDLAERLDAEIINADSVQVYKDFNIGACKPSEEELRRVPHHLVSALGPDEIFDAGVFCSMADRIIDSLHQDGKAPFVVGGTGLYIRSLFCGLVDAPRVTPQALDAIESREAELCQSAAEDDSGWRHEMHRWLAELDPASAERLHPNDISRVRRALGVVLSTSDSLTKLQTEHAHSGERYRGLVLIIEPPREELYQAINDRVDIMFEAGFIDEVRALLSRYPRSVRALGSIGYNHVVQHVDNELSEEQTRELIKRDTRRYAKRQFTWWRNQPVELGWEDWQSRLSQSTLHEDYHGLVADLTEIIRKFLTRERDYATEGIAFLRVPALNKGTSLN